MSNPVDIEALRRAVAVEHTTTTIDTRDPELVKIDRYVPVKKDSKPPSVADESEAQASIAPSLRDQDQDVEPSDDGFDNVETFQTTRFAQGHMRMVKIPMNAPVNRGEDGEDGEDGGDSGDAFEKDPERDAPIKLSVFAAGYPSTAAIMSTDPELSVWRRFDRMNTRNLLYFQAELMDIERRMDKMDEEDRLREPEKKRHLRHFGDLKDSDYNNERLRMRTDLMYEMRSVLSQYNEAVYYYREMMNNPEPSNRVVTSIRNWRANQGHPPIVDISESAYDELHESDLMALKPPKSDDRVTIFVQDNLGRFFKSPKPAHIPGSENVLYYSETAIDFFTTVICALLAIIVLVGSMTTLFFVESQGVRLGLVWVFTFLFAISIFLMANLSKGEIFLATAAYCAILVVYISGG